MGSAIHAVTPRYAKSLTQNGTGDVQGLQLTARVTGYRGLFGWLSYNLSRSRRTDADDPAVAPRRYFDHDQTNGLILRFLGRVDALGPASRTYRQAA